MYTILIKQDNTAVSTETQRIMQRSKLVDTLQFIVPKMYEDYEMREFDFMLQYRLPISHELKWEILTLVNEDYKTDYLLYTVPIDTSLTVENGEVEMQLSFIRKSMQEDGTTIEQVREIAPVTITIIPVTDWFTVPDSALSTLTQYYLAAQNNIKALNDLIGTINQNKADNIKLDVEDGSLYLTANGKQIGTPIPLEQLGDEVAEETKGGLIRVNI